MTAGQDPGRQDPDGQGETTAGVAVEAAEEVLLALADPIRRRILGALAGGHPETATTLAAELPVSRQAVVKHLAVLERAGLVAGRRSGREVRYLLRPQPLEATSRWLAGLALQWSRRLETIKQIAESAAAPAPGPTSSEQPSSEQPPEPPA